MIEIQPDILLIQGRASNFYLCIDQDGLTLIDAGMPKEKALLFKVLDEFGYQPQQLLRILVTHADIDHAGSLAAIQSVTGAAVFAGEETAQLLQKGKSPDHLPRLIQWLANTFFKYQPVPQSCLHIVNDGDELPVLNGLVALATPGHTNDHFSFYSVKKGVLFTGDAINNRNGILQRTPKRITADEEAANQSAISLIELAPATILCGHGDPIRDHDAADLTTFFNNLRQNE
jgi:glyoxylase-like metal-dependent hydrolase (beta-lactamase superfamily II)